MPTTVGAGLTTPYRILVLPGDFGHDKALARVAGVSRVARLYDAPAPHCAEVLLATGAACLPGGRACRAR